VKRLAVLACAAAFALPAFADAKVGAGEMAVAPGYAFDRPGVLVDQLIWGIAHGARLLALACARTGHGAAAEAWVAWQEREAAQIDVIRAALGQYYFQRDDASYEAIVAALGLSPTLDLSPEQLAPACATLAEALAQPRYDLAKRRETLLKELETKQ
jgi:hypothetical protein